MELLPSPAWSSSRDGGSGSGGAEGGHGDAVAVLLVDSDEHPDGMVVAVRVPASGPLAPGASPAPGAAPPGTARLRGQPSGWPGEVVAGSSAPDGEAEQAEGGAPCHVVLVPGGAFELRQMCMAAVAPGRAGEEAGREEEEEVMVAVLRSERMVVAVDVFRLRPRLLLAALRAAEAVHSPGTPAPGGTTAPTPAREAPPPVSDACPPWWSWRPCRCPAAVRISAVPADAPPARQWRAPRAAGAEEEEEEELEEFGWEALTPPAPTLPLSAADGPSARSPPRELPVGSFPTAQHAHPPAQQQQQQQLGEGQVPGPSASHGRQPGRPAAPGPRLLVHFSHLALPQHTVALGLRERSATLLHVSGSHLWGVCSACVGMRICWSVCTSGCSIRCLSAQTHVCCARRRRPCPAAAVAAART